MKKNLKRKTILPLIMACMLCFTAPGWTDPAAAAETETESAAETFGSPTISYLGPEGTYTQEACERFFSGQGSYLPCETVNAAVEALVSEESDYAVIPQENTIGGAVTDYLDILIAQTDVSVVGEVELPISQNLLVLPGTALAGIKTVYSHKQGIAQGREWLEKNLPEAEVIEVSSTAEGARMVSEGSNPSLAAIASAGCADVYHLEILAADIQNNDNNKTRFYVLGAEEPQTGPGDRLAFIAAGNAEKLPALMSNLEKMKMELVTIHDRPLKTELGEYAYLIECKNSSYQNYKKLVGSSSFEFRYLGSFNIH